jgi:hypothetical protein
MEKRERIKVQVSPEADWRAIVAEYQVSRHTAQRALKRGYLVVNHCQKGLYPLVDRDLPEDFVPAAYKMASLTYQKNFRGRAAYNIEKEDLIQEGVVRLLELAGHPRFGERKFQFYACLNAMISYNKANRRHAHDHWDDDHRPGAREAWEADAA